MPFDLVPTPHQEAIDLITGKPILTADVFRALLPELRGRAFTVTGLQSADVMQRIRDAIAALPNGSVWGDVKADIADELDPFLGDGADARAELLIRTHGFQAFQASNWRVIQQDGDTTHIQYMTMEDERVRDSHAALNGIILPKDDPFWQLHYPPWDWNCRCTARPMNVDLVDEARQADEQRNPDDQYVIEGPALDQLEHGTLIRNGQAFNVSPPSEGPEGDKAFRWNPDDMNLPLGDIKLRYDPEVWNVFEEQAKNTMIDDHGTTLWNYIMSKPAKPDKATRSRQDRLTRSRLNAQPNPI